MAFTAAQAKSLCTASELNLVMASTRREIGQYSAPQLRQKIARARNLRDKWQDQSKGQRRTTQAAQGARQITAGARSTEKAELFAEVLQRFEAQYARLEAKGAPTGPKPQGMPRRVRSATHRATRAVVRDALKDSQRELSSKKKSAAKLDKSKKPGPASTAAEQAVEAESARTAASKPTKPAKKSGQGKLATAGVGMTAVESARGVQGLRVTKGKQLRAKTAAKQNRLKEGGVLRAQMHASSRTKRRQGKRDAR
jgi:hypothetical protein